MPTAPNKAPTIVTSKSASGVIIIALFPPNSNNDFPNSIEQISEQVRIYPNPFTDILYFEDREDIEIRDVLGKLVYYSLGTNQVQTSDWYKGIYFIYLKNKNRIIKVIKI